MPAKLPRVNIPGLDKLNKALDAWCTAIERGLNIEGSGVLSVSEGPTGKQVVDMSPTWRDVALTSVGASAGSYNFSEIFPSTGGVWTTYPTALTGLAWEFNKTAGLLAIATPFYTKIRWFQVPGLTGEWRFQAGACGTSGSSSAAFPAWLTRTPSGPATTDSAPTTDPPARKFPF